jgi:hypothetical protein
MRIITVLLYMAVFCLAYFASTATFQMQRHVSAVSTGMQKALRLTAIHMLEATESVQLRNQASYDAYQAQEMEQESQQFQSRAEWEHEVAAQQNRQRGDFLAKLAVWDQGKANVHWANVERDQELHEQIMANLTLATEQHEETLEELQNKMQSASSFCNMTTLFSSLCHAIGSVASLQEKSDHEALQIQKEWNDATAADQDEVMELTVAKLLQRQADEYNETSQKLLAAATAWDERAQLDFEAAQRDHVASQSYQAAASELAHQAQREEEWNAKCNEMVHLVLMQAQVDHVKANWKAIQGILCAAIVLIFVIPRAMTKVHVHCTALGRRQECMDNASTSFSLSIYVGHGASALLAHVLIFLLVVGIVGDYLVSLQEHGIEERAVIILWFAAVGASTQVIVLHGIRAVYTELTMNSVASASLPDSNSAKRRDWANVCWQLGKRFVVLLILFIMEVLFCWLAMGNKLLFQPSVVALLSTWAPFRLCALALLAWHVVCVDLGLLSDEIDGNSSLQEQQGEESTVWSSFHRNYNNNATEITPLNKQEILSATTPPIDIYRPTGGAPPDVALASTTANSMVDSNHRRDPSMMHESTTASQDDDDTMTTLTTNTLGFERTAATMTSAAATTPPSPPRHYYSLYRGFSNLLLPLEIFLITCMVTVVSTDLQVVWHSQARIGQCFALGCVVVLLILTCVVIQRRTTTMMGQEDENDLDKMGSSGNEIMTASLSDIHGPLLSDHDLYNDDYNVSSHKTTRYSFIDRISSCKTGHNSNSFGIFPQPKKLPHYELVSV